MCRGPPGTARPGLSPSRLFERPAPGRATLWLLPLHDHTRPRESRAERAEHQLHPGLDATAPHRLVERDRHGGCRRVAEAVHVHVDLVHRHAGVPMDKVYVNVDRFGNTSAASVAIALDEAVRCGRVQPGMKLMFCAFGAGFTWASMVVQW